MTINNITTIRWTDDHDLPFVRGILPFEPFKYPNGSTEKGQAWKFVADSTNQLGHAKFDMSRTSFKSI